MVKFAHLADCHLGAWKMPEMSHLNSKTFEMAIDSCIEQKVDFVLIAGDFFDTAMPSIDVLKLAARKLKELKDSKIPCYIIPGSHDFSISGKTFLDVLSNAGLCTNVESSEELEIFSEGDVIIAGIAGLKTQKEQEIIKKIKTPSLEKHKDKLKILMLHTTLNENAPNEFGESILSEDLPRGFDYYALGHIHKPSQHKIDGAMIVYPGPLFPNNFSEMEEIGCGGFVIATYSDGKLEIERQEIKLKEILPIEIDASNLGPEMVTAQILSTIKKENVEDKIVMLKLYGTLSRGKTSDIDFKTINTEAEKKQKYSLLKNTSGLESLEFQIKVNVKSDNIEEIEKEVMDAQRILGDDLGKIFQDLLKCLDAEKYEGETSTTFEKRLLEGAYSLMKL